MQHAVVPVPLDFELPHLVTVAVSPFSCMPDRRAILKMAQYGIMVAPHGNKGTMVTRSARATLPGDLMDSSLGLRMVSGSATERVSAKWN